MSICDDCKHRKNKWCKYFSASLIGMGEIRKCIGYKKKTNQTNDIKKRSIKQEKKLANDIGAKITPQSGAQNTAPSDMIKGNFIIESKATKGKSISVKEAWLHTLKYTPMHLGKIPTLILEFLGRGRYVVMSEDDFKTLIKESECIHEVKNTDCICVKCGKCLLGCEDSSH